MTVGTGPLALVALNMTNKSYYLLFCYTRFYVIKQFVNKIA